MSNKRARMDSKVEVLSVEGTPPLSRVKSSSAVTHGGKLFLFGGFDEDDNLDGNVYILDIKTKEWETHKHHVYREGHSALGIGGDEVLIYGGIPEDYNTPQAVFQHDVLMIYNVSTNVWRAGPLMGNVPVHRSRHAACLSTDGTKMFVSGGQLHEEGTPLDDLYCYDIQTGVWDGPRHFTSRFDHSIVFHDDKIWAFGGLTVEMAHSTEVAYFDLRTNTTGSIVMHDLPKLEGDHIYLPTRNDSLVLDVVVPSWIFERVEPSIGLYDLKDLRWQAVLTGTFRPLVGYRWRHTCVYDGTLFLLGYPVNTEDQHDNTYDHKLTNVVQLSLSELGVTEPMTTRHVTAGGLVSDIFKMLSGGEYTDFKIIGVEGNERPPPTANFIDRPRALDTPFAGQDPDTFIKSQAIPVHSLILRARWPHFQRVADSGMIEAQTGTLFIPEPVEWLHALIEYLYTDEIGARSMDILTGLLVLANIYDLPRLRVLCIQQIYAHGLKIKNCIKVWSRSRMVNEHVLEHNAATFCFYNWGKVVKTKHLKDLSKEELVALCQAVDNDSMIFTKRPNGVLTGAAGEEYYEQPPYLLEGSPHAGMGYVDTMHHYKIGYQSHNDDDDEDNEDEDSTDDQATRVSMGSRFTTPQGSIYMGNAQLGMNSLGERREGDDTDMDDTDA